MKYLLGNHFYILTDHKALVTYLKENRGNRRYQSRQTRWTDRLLALEFSISNISGINIGIADYLPRNPKFRAPPQWNYDEQFVVKSIQNFDNAS